MDKENAAAGQGQGLTGIGTEIERREGQDYTRNAWPVPSGDRKHRVAGLRESSG